jgi:hypothetical protein
LDFVFSNRITKFSEWEEFSWIDISPMVIEQGSKIALKSPLRDFSSWVVQEIPKLPYCTGVLFQLEESSLLFVETLFTFGDHVQVLKSLSYRTLCKEFRMSTFYGWWQCGAPVRVASPRNDSSEAQIAHPINHRSSTKWTKRFLVTSVVFRAWFKGNVNWFVDICHASDVFDLGLERVIPGMYGLHSLAFQIDGRLQSPVIPYSGNIWPTLLAISGCEHGVINMPGNAGAWSLTKPHIGWPNGPCAIDDFAN